MRYEPLVSQLGYWHRKSHRSRAVRRTSKDFLAFLDSVVKEYPNQRLAIVLDNLNTHTNEAARKWLKSHPHVSFHYTPTHASWVNLIECFFSILTRQGLQQAVHQSGQELEHL